MSEPVSLHHQRARDQKPTSPSTPLVATLPRAGLHPHQEKVARLKRIVARRRALLDELARWDTAGTKRGAWRRVI